MQCSDCLREDEKSSYRQKCCRDIATERTKWLITASSEWLQWDRKVEQTFLGGLTVDCNYMSACWSGSACQRGEHLKIICVQATGAIHRGAQARFVFRLLFNKSDLFSLSVPNSEGQTDFTLGPSFTLPPHSVKHSYSILSADFSILTHVNTPAAVYANTSAKSLSVTEFLVSVGSRINWL